MMCVHDINKNNHDIILDKTIRTMEFPEKTWGVCKYCGNSLVFIKVKDVFLEI